MSKTKPALPNEFFDDATLKRTYNFIESLQPNEIMRYRKSYRRELNQSSDDNVLPETTQTQRRCFMYLTNHVETITV